MIRGKYGVKIAENVVWKRSDESWKNVVGFPPGCNHLSGDCWLRGSVDCRKPAAGHTLQTPPNVHLHATDPPTVRPPSDYLYTADFQNVRAYDGAEQTP